MATPGLSIRELILTNIEETLATVTMANGYATTIGTVTRGRLSPLENGHLPFASVIPVSDTPDYGAQVLRRALLLTVRLWIDDTPANASSTLEALLADVQTVLEADVERGGYAHHTLEEGVSYIYVVSTERLAGADVSFKVDYTTSQRDQRVQI